VIFALLKLHWIRLTRDRRSLVLIYLLPMLLFSVMATAYRGLAEFDELPKTQLYLLDQDRSASSILFTSLLSSQDMVRVSEAGTTSLEELLARDRSVVVEIPVGFGEKLSKKETVKLFLYEDRSDPLAALVARNLVRAVTDRLVMYSGIRSELPPAVSEYMEGLFLEQAKARKTDTQDKFRIERVDYYGTVRTPGADVTIAYYAAGIGVLFLLFAMMGGGASLLEEEESGRLERLLVTGVKPMTLIASWWLNWTLTGLLQIVVMFIWASLVHGLDLFNVERFFPFLLLTALASAVASAIILVAALLCRSRTQFITVSTILILMMSAIGGSMFPRYLMTEELRNIGNLTFNAWALDAYQSLFWHDASISELWPQFRVLLLLLIVFCAALLGLSRRWHTSWKG
jgi:ABC-2 type transport system permease protein